MCKGSRRTPLYRPQYTHLNFPFWLEVKYSKERSNALIRCATFSLDLVWCTEGSRTIVGGKKSTSKFFTHVCVLCAVVLKTTCFKLPKTSVLGPFGGEVFPLTHCSECFPLPSLVCTQTTSMAHTIYPPPSLAQAPRKSGK